MKATTKQDDQPTPTQHCHTAAPNSDVCTAWNQALVSQLLVHDEVWNIQGIHKRMARFQKLTRNVFLALHGHNVNRQQRQLSKFVMRYQQLASHAYCGAAGPVSKMGSQQEKAFYVLRFEVSR